MWRREVTVYADHTGKLLKDPIKIRWIISLKPYAADGTISFEFHPKLKPYLAVLKENFTRHTLGKVSRMTSLHAIRLYELLLDWGQDFRHHHKEVEISWLKKIFMVENQYAAINDFKKKVIDIATTQINQHSDLTCSYTQRKTGRNVTHLTFNFNRKPEAKTATEPKTKPIIKRATQPTIQSAAPNPNQTSKEVKQALRELLAARKKIMPPEIKTKPEPPPTTSSPAKSIAQIMNEIVPTLQRGNDQALAPGF